jgi:signal peptidase I
VSHLLTWLRWALLGLALGLAFAVAAPRAIGWSSLTVVSGSMAPTIATGDVVLARPITPADARPGDVVTYADPQRQGRLVTHRVMRVHPAGAAVEFVTKGDANTASEAWAVPANGTIGRVEVRIPWIGRGLSFAGSSNGRMALVAVPALLWGLLSLRAIWREPVTAEVGHAAS